MIEVILNKTIGVIFLMFAAELFGFPVLTKTIHWIKTRFVWENEN